MNQTLNNIYISDSLLSLEQSHRSIILQISANGFVQIITSKPSVLVPNFLSLNIISLLFYHKQSILA